MKDIDSLFMIGIVSIPAIWTRPKCVRANNTEDSAQGAEGECDLRTLDRKCSARMFRLHDPDQRDTHSPDAEILGRTLQSRPPSFESWTGNAGPKFTEGRSSSPTPLHSEGVPSCSDIDS